MTEVSKNPEKYTEDFFEKLHPAVLEKIKDVSGLSKKVYAKRASEIFQYNRNKF